MRVVIDAVPMRGDSLSIVVEHLLEGWGQIDWGDEIHLVVGPDPQVDIPDGVIVHHLDSRRRSFLGRLHAQSIVIPRLCRALDADIMLGVLPTTTITPLPCPRAIVVYDLRYKLRPEGFTKKSRVLRNLSYALGFRQADASICISERTKDDLLRFYPKMAKRPLRVAHLGADHVDTWSRRPPETPYAIAFSHYQNKNVDLVLDAWALRHARDKTSLPLALVGVSSAERPRIEERIERLGMTGFVTVFPWLPIEVFQETFASSSLVVFPSDFEGFGLPAAEAMRLGIPVVISADLALLEVTNGHAIVMDGTGPESLVRAVAQAEQMTLQQIAAARDHADRFTWSSFAGRTRWLLAETVGLATAGDPVRTPALEPAPVLAAARAASGHRHSAPRRSIGWIGALSAGTLALSAVSAASIVLVARSHPHATDTQTHTTTTTTAQTSTTTGHKGPGFVPMPPAKTSETSTTSSTGQDTSPPTTATSHPSTSIGGTGVTVPSVTLPATIPTITLPTLPPLPTVVCGSGTSTGTGPVHVTVTVPPSLQAQCKAPAANHS